MKLGLFSIQIKDAKEKDGFGNYKMIALTNWAKLPDNAIFLWGLYCVYVSVHVCLSHWGGYWSYECPCCG